MKPNPPAQRKTKRGQAKRAFCALVLLWALCNGAIPAGSLLADEMCRMACCVGKAPHSARACSGGACHVDFAALLDAPAKREKVCDLKSYRLGHMFRARWGQAANRVGAGLAWGLEQVAPRPPAGSNATRSRPLEPPCRGAGNALSASGFSASASGGAALTSVLSDNLRPRLLSTVRALHGQPLSRALRPGHRANPQRGPPLFLSRN